VKRRKAGAPPTVARSRAQGSLGGNIRRCRADMVGMRLSALRLPFLRMIVSESRTPLFGIMRMSRRFFPWRGGGWQSSGANAPRERGCARCVPDAVQRHQRVYARLRRAMAVHRRAGTFADVRVRNDPGSARITSCCAAPGTCRMCRPCAERRCVV
jgi:hypothetical protein